MADGSEELFKVIQAHYIKKLGSGEVDAAVIYNELVDVFARMLATQPNAENRRGLINHLILSLPAKVETYVAAQVAQGDFGKVAPKPKPKSQILKPTEREKRFVDRAKGDLK